MRKGKTIAPRKAYYKNCPREQSGTVAPQQSLPQQQLESITLALISFIGSSL